MCAPPLATLHHYQHCVTKNRMGEKSEKDFHPAGPNGKENCWLLLLSIGGCVTDSTVTPSSCIATPGNNRQGVNIGLLSSLGLGVVNG